LRRTAPFAAPIASSRRVLAMAGARNRSVRPFAKNCESQRKPAKMKALSFAFFCFSESGLFKGL